MRRSGSSFYHLRRRLCMEQFEDRVLLAGVGDGPTDEAASSAVSQDTVRPADWPLGPPAATSLQKGIELRGGGLVLQLDHADQVFRIHGAEIGAESFVPLMVEDNVSIGRLEHNLFWASDTGAILVGREGSDVVTIDFGKTASGGLVSQTPDSSLPALETSSPQPADFSMMSFDGLDAKKNQEAALVSPPPPDFQSVAPQPAAAELIFAAMAAPAGSPKTQGHSALLNVESPPPSFSNTSDLASKSFSFFVAETHAEENDQPLKARISSSESRIGASSRRLPSLGVSLQTNGAWLQSGFAIVNPNFSIPMPTEDVAPSQVVESKEGELVERYPLQEFAVVLIAGAALASVAYHIRGRLINNVDPLEDSGTMAQKTTVWFQR